MGFGIEVVAGRVTNPGGTFTALTANTGSSFTVKSAQESSPVFLDDMWAKGATAGVFRLRSPRLHDNTTGIAAPYQTTNSRSALDYIPGQPLVPNDAIIAEATGGAAETDVAAAVYYYENLDGIAAVLASHDEILPRVKNLVTVQVNVTGAATLGDWSAGTALNATDDKLHADETYALLGYLPTNPVLAIAIAGADTGNLRVGGPGTSEQLETRNWFVRKSIETGRPYIPVIKANNKGSTLVFQCDNAAGATNNTFLILAELQ